MNQPDWNPDLYLKFDKERTQPSIDLVARMDHPHPRTIIDIGCGPGNSTQVLYKRWPAAHITGADNSPAMIQKASTDYPHQHWALFDAGKDSLDETFDIVFSNATIQWIPNHDILIRKFAGMLNEQGVLAVQLPLFLDMPMGQSIAEIGRHSQWSAVTKGLEHVFTIHHEAYYYDQLSLHFSEIDIWTTDYYHVMPSHLAILEMMRSTGLKLYLERITGEQDRKLFESMVLQSIQRDYPAQSNGRVLFPFKRLFFTAKK